MCSVSRTTFAIFPIYEHLGGKWHKQIYKWFPGSPTGWSGELQTLQCMAILCTLPEARLDRPIQMNSLENNQSPLLKG